MSNFETWWEREGQEFLYALNTTTDDDIKLVAEIAWENGAYCAEQAEQEPVRKCDGLLCNDCGEYKQKYKNLPGLTEKDLCICEQAAPVSTKDLTPHEITALIREGAADGGWQGFAQRVQNAFKEKNRG